MALNNTGNSVPSTAVPDFQDNVQVLDSLLNGEAIEVTGRTGKELKSIAYLQSVLTSLDVGSFTFSDTASGLAGTTSGQYFRVPQGSDSDLAFIYYQNSSGTAVEVASLGSDNKITINFLMSKSNELNSIGGKAVASGYPELLFSGPIESITIPESGAKLAVVRDLSATSVDTRSYLVFSATVNGSVSSRYLPATLLMMQGGHSWSYYESVDILNLSDGKIAESGNSMVRVSYACGKTLDVSDNSSFTVIDVTGAFTPGVASGGISYAQATIMGSSDSGRIQFVLPISDIESAGYSVDSAESIYQYIRVLGADSYILAKTNKWNKNDDLSRYAQIEVEEGGASISCKALLADGSESLSPYSAIISLYGSRSERSLYQSDFWRFTGDVTNRSTYNYKQYPFELKVSLPAGMARNDEGLVLIDDSGNEYPCQFSGESHPNRRLHSDRSRNHDGSLGSGSLFYMDTLDAGASKNMELRAYSVEMQGVSRPSLAITNESTRSIVVGGYTYSFSRQQNWCLTSISDPSGTNHSVIHSTHVAGLSSGAITEVGASYMPSLRLITSGPVFAELEHVVFNSAALSIPSKSIRFTTRYRLFANGKVQVKVIAQAQVEIATGILCGAHSRLSLNDGVYASDANAMSVWWSDATSGKNLTITGMRCAGDEHRDGTNYGPTRPAQASIVYPDNKTTRMYLGWKYTSATDYSFLNWKVNKDWAWVQEFWVDLDCSADQVARDIIGTAYNRPVGYLGESSYPSVIKNKIIRKIEDHMDGSMEWWYSFDSAGFGGMPYNDASADRVWNYAAISYDIMRHIRYGWSTVDSLYSTLDKYIRWIYGATTISQIGTQFLAGKVLLQFASRLCIPPLEWLYKLAVKEGNTAVKTNLEGCIKSFSDAIVTYYNANGGVGLDGSKTDNGNSNSNASALRILALGIYAGQDASGSYLTAFNGIEKLLSNTSTYLYVENVLKDGANEVLPTRNWLHYQMYAMNSYACACYLLGREQSFNMITYTLMASSAKGGFHEIDYCVSESRRGSFNTFQLAMYNLIYSKSASAMNLAYKSMDLFTTEYGPAPGHPKRAFGFDGTTSEAYAITDIPFVANGFADIWLREYFMKIGDKNFS